MDILIPWSNSREFHGTPWRSVELDAVVSMEFRRTFPLNSIEIDVLIPHGMPWKFFPRKSMEFHGGISYGMYQGHPTTIFGKYLFGRRFDI